jgi:hypothetical protein
VQVYIGFVIEFMVVEFHNILNFISVFHSSSDSSSSSGSAVSNSNHHYNENSSLGVSLGGSKTSNFIHIDTIEITNKDLSSNRFKLSVSVQNYK